MTTGISKGRKLKSVEIAKTMLEEGMDITMVAKFTGLSMKELQKLTIIEAGNNKT